jgi:hypothetical protein
MLSICFINSLYDAVSSFICQMAMHHEECVNDPGDPEEKREEDADDCLYWLATQEDS